MALAIALIALALRWRAVLMLPTDYDEPVYLEAAFQYARALTERDWTALLLNRHTLEHPPLVKLLYAGGIWLRGQAAAQTTARAISAVLGTLQAALLALLNPLAGFLLAIHTMSIKYTSQAYLEALPALTSLLAVLAYERSSQREEPANRWLFVSAAALGVTAASKYTYLVVGLAILPFLVWRNRQRIWVVTLFLGIALSTFFLLDVQIRADPLGRLRDSLLFHFTYTRSQLVTGLNRPWWQPFYYLSHSIPWHPGVFVISMDTFVFVLGMLGLPFLFRRGPIAFLWLCVGMAALLLWPTKWPQYTLLVTAPLCLSAGVLIQSGVEWLDRHTEVVRTLRSLAPDRATSLLIFVVVIGLLVALTFMQWQYSQESQDWTVYATRNSALPSDTVRALAVDREGHIWAGTDAGAALFKDGAWTTFNTANSPLLSNSIRSLAVDDAGRVWFGTDEGASVWDGEHWQGYTTHNSGLVNDHILSIAPVPTSTETDVTMPAVWLGTAAGLSYFDGVGWTNYTPDNSGLVGARVLSIALDAQGHAWCGTWGGLSVWDGRGWTSYTTHNSGLAFDTVSAVAVDGQGRIWCGTLDGVSVWDGGRWRNYSISDMSLPFNTATTLAIDPVGHVWVGADLPVGPIGGAAMFDGKRWHDYSQHFARQRQAPVRAIAIDPAGRVWFATLLEGIIVFTGLSSVTNVQ